MDIRISYDANAESGVRSVVEEIGSPTRTHFAAKDFGDGLRGIGIIVMCRNPELNFKQRLRFSRRSKTIDMDVMLDLHEMTQASHQDRKRRLITRLADEVPPTLRKYSISDFDETRFIADLRTWFKEIGT